MIPVLAIILCGNFLLSFAQPDSNSSEFPQPSEIRFCGLKHNATCFCCSEINYASSVATRALGPIIIAGIIFIISSTAICAVACCCRKDNKDLDQIGIRKFGIISIPIILLLIGAALVLVGNFTLDPPFVQGQNIVNDRNSYLQSLQEETIANVSTPCCNIAYPSTNVANWKAGWSEVDKKANNYITFVKAIDIARTLLTWLSVGLAIIIGLCGCCFFYNAKDAPITVMLLASFFLILGSSLSIASFFMFNIVASDICAETSFGPNGMLNLIKSEAQRNINDFSADIIANTDSAILTGCGAIEEICRTWNQLCDLTCDESNYETIASKILLDAPNFLNVSSCALTCTRQSLRENSATYMDQIPILRQLGTMENDYIELDSGFADDSTISKLNSAFCGSTISTPIAILYTATACYIGGAIAAIIGSVFTERRWGIV